MTRIQKTALLAFLLLLVVSVIGAYLGGGKARPADAQPATVVLETEELAAIRLLPPERRQMIQPQRFSAPPAKNPLQDLAGREAGGEVTPTAPVLPGGGERTPGPGNDVNLAEAGYRSIRVRQNEVLSRIAKRELGDSGRWREILKLNGMESDQDLRVGQKLYLPPRDAAAASFEGPAQDSSQANGEATVYVVQRGDVLGRIAKQFYGSAQETERILRANGLQNANQIYAGQELVIPPRGNQ